jgi:osmotically-inducible protein OsmY
MTTTILNRDSEIQRGVLQELKWDPRVNETEVGVQVKDGIVTLVGKVNNFAKKQVACEAAHRVSGVLDVVNDLEVHIGSVWAAKSDTEIAQSVRNALVWDAFVPDREIRSTVADGWVTLEGDVGHSFEREDAGRVVSRLHGVRGVTNRIAVKPRSVDADKIRSSIQEALKRQSEREARRIEIRVQDGAVTLHGKVRSWTEKNAIESVASFAPGVSRVDNQLVIDSYS